MAGGGVGEAMAIGALMGAGTGGIMAAAQDKDPLQGALLGAVTGAATGAAGSSIGGALGGSGGAAGGAGGGAGGVGGTVGGTAGGTTGGTVGGTVGGTTGTGATSLLGPGGSSIPGIGASAPSGIGNLTAGQYASIFGQAPSSEAVLSQAVANAPTQTASSGIGQGFAKSLTNAQAYGAGAAGGLGGLYGGSQVPATQEWPNESEPESPLSYFKYDPTKYKADQPTPNVYTARYADGGIANLSQTSPMSNTVYPQSQQTQTAFSSSPQYPSSMRSAMAADYDARTNPMYGTEIPPGYADGGIASLGSYSDGGRLTRGPGDGVSDSIPASIGGRQPARLADGEFVVPSRIVSELGNGSTDAGARRLYDMMDRVQARRSKTMGKGKVAKNTRAYQELPA